MVALMLLVAAAVIAVEAVSEIITPHHTPARFTLAVLVGVVVVKEVLFRRVYAVGTEVGSEAVRADAWHHRSDAITSLAAFIGISIAIGGGPGWESADDWAALVASVVIVWNGQRLLRPAVAGLMDRTADPEILYQINTIASGVEDVHAVEKTIVRRAGMVYFVDLHVHADPAMLCATRIVVARSSARSWRPSAVRGVLIHMGHERKEQE